jgi:hypothetical protein
MTTRTKIDGMRLWAELEGSFRSMKGCRACEMPLPQPIKSDGDGPNWKLTPSLTCEQRCHVLIEALYRQYSEVYDVKW